MELIAFHVALATLEIAVVTVVIFSFTASIFSPITLLIVSQIESTVSLQFSQINRNGSVMIWKAALIISFTAMIPTVTMFLIVSHAPDKNPVIESQIFVKVSWISVMVPVTLE